MMKISMSSSDEEIDDLPLKYMSSSYKKYNCLRTLKQYSVHACDICEKVFENRYDYFIHNSKHIIIPLIKILPYYCKQCDQYGASKEEMDEHVNNKHMNLAENKNKLDSKPSILSRIQFETDIDEEFIDEDDHIPLISCIKSDSNIPHSHAKNGVKGSILENFIVNCNVDMEKYQPRLSSSTKTYENNKCIKTDSSNFKNIRKEFKDSTQEEAVDCNDFLEDCLEELDTLSQYKVTNNSFNNYFGNKTGGKQKRDDFISQIEELRPSTALEKVIEENESELKNYPSEFGPLISLNSAINGVVDNFKITIDTGDSDNTDLDEDPIVILGPIQRGLMVDSIKKTHDSVHFDDLMKPGVFQCKRCSKRFPNRYSVIVHEATHMNLSKALVKSKGKRLKSLACSATDSSGVVQSDKTFTKCPQCLQQTTDLDMHKQTCTVSYCDDCGKFCPNKLALGNHKLTCRQESELNLCDTCLYFRERPKYIHYTSITRMDNSTVKQCHSCGKVSKGTSLVRFKESKRGKKVMSSKLADRITYEGGVKVDGVASKSVACGPMGHGKGKPHKKGLSNRERLKLIQQRLKLMKQYR